MKYFLVAPLLWSFWVQAQEHCPSVWVFKANKTCSDLSHGLDFDHPKESFIQHEWSNPQKGGRDQLQVCLQVRNRFNQQYASKGWNAELAQGQPVDERHDKDVIGQVTYKYLCKLSVKSYEGKVASSPVCGQEDKWSYKVGGDQPEGASCLSCDDKQTPKETVNCLKNHIAQIIQPKAIDLRDEDLAAVAQQSRRMLKINKSAPIEGLQKTEDIEVIVDFIDSIPSGNRQ